jgi:hypothetical protein
MGAEVRKAQESLDIPDDAPLTQYGEIRPSKEPQFRKKPREEIFETDVSLIWGRLTPSEASRRVTHVVSPLAAARYTTAGALRAVGFAVRHTPGRSNPKHVSVVPDTEHPEPADWDDSMAESFDKCFTEPVGGETTT